MELDFLNLLFSVIKKKKSNAIKIKTNEIHSLLSQ